MTASMGDNCHVLTGQCKPRHCSPARPSTDAERRRRRAKHGLRACPV